VNLVTQDKINIENCNKNGVYEVKFRSFNQLTGANQKFITSYSKHIDMKCNIHKSMFAIQLLDCRHEEGNVLVDDTMVSLKTTHKRQIRDKHICEKYSTRR
jgi:hypothetical protein